MNELIDSDDFDENPVRQSGMMGWGKVHLRWRFNGLTSSEFGV